MPIQKHRDSIFPDHKGFKAMLLSHLISQLVQRQGCYFGYGINHEQQSFRGDFELKSIVGEQAVQIAFTATGDDGCIYHTEMSTIGSSLDQKLQLWNINSNVPGMLTHDLRSEQATNEGHRFVFGLNDPENAQVFREEIHLEIFQNGDVGYHYYWGIPGGEFAYRSGLKMKKFDL